jgi:DNA-binding beta-propeller fold protein YncE
MTALAACVTAAAHGERHPGGFDHESWNHKHAGKPSPKSFERIATLANYAGNADAGDSTVAEIIASTANGRTLVYTDSPREEIGFIDITKPHIPVPAGKLAVGGQPTSVAVLGNELALVGVDTSTTFAAPTGHLAVVDIKRRKIVRDIPLGGQPDSVAISPDGKFAAIAIENQRDEEIVVDGVEGGLPQLPAGQLVIVDLRGHGPKAWSVRTVDLTGLAAYAPEDPETEFVDINHRNEAVITLQENNHVVIVDLRTGKVVEHFPAGTVTLNGVDATEDGVIDLSETLLDVPREPDAVAWISTGDKQSYIATANEGDLFGGSRGFSIFDRRGNVVFDSGSSFEEIAVRHGHYPEARSDAKGSEPESIEYASFRGTDYLFVGSERGSFVAVYELRRAGRPEFVQLLPGPLGPEGVHAMPSRDLLVVSGEEDDPQFGVRSTVMIYKLRSGEPAYPQLMSTDDASGRPIPWSAMSGMTAVPGRRDQLLAVWDSFYSDSRIFTIDVAAKPALVTNAITIEGGSGGYDPEGIAVAPDRTLWIASEGNASGSVPNLLIQTDESGVVLQEIGLPAEIEACRAASTNRGTLGSGFEGVAVARTPGGYVLVVAQQRGWDYTTPECEELDDDPNGTNPAEPPYTRIWIYDPQSGAWEHVAYELEALPSNASWVGLSEITAVPGGYIVIERDNRTGDFAELKTLVKFDLRAARDGIITRAEKKSYDLLPDLLATRGWITDKPEGVAVTRDGRLFVVTDNDGVDDWSGETWFLRLGQWQRLFR